MPSKLSDILKKTASVLDIHKLHVAAGAGVLLLFILGAVLLSNLGGRDEGAAEESGAVGRDDRIRTLIPPEAAFLPNERRRLLEIEEKRYREPRTPWEEDLVDQFWNPVRETAIDALMEAGRGEIDELFEEIE